MDKIFDYIVAQTTSGNIWYALIVLAVVYAFKKEPFKIFAHFNEQAKSDIRLAKELLESNILSKETNDLIREKIEQFMFKKLYGINADKMQRKYLSIFREKNYLSITWKDLKLAKPHYDFDGNKIVVKITIRDKIISFFIKLAWISIATLSITIVIFAVFFKAIEAIDNYNFYTLIFLSWLFAAAACIYKSENWSYESALKIKTLIKD
jgi:hypothetical protein